MITILIRTLIIYFLLVGSMRLMGKRQIGELDVSDIVTTLMISEIASLPITNQEIPLMFAVIPIITLLTIEVSSSCVLSKTSRFKNVFSARPTVIINKGKLDQKALGSSRISIDEFISELRQSNISNVSDVYYAILEKSGKLTIIPKASSQPPTCEQLGISAQESGIMHIIICDGQIDKHNLSLIGKKESWIESLLKPQGLSLKDVFFMSADDGGKYEIIRKEK